MSEPAAILIVEDDEDDFFFTRRALRKFTAAPVNHVESGREAIDYLAGEGRYADREAFPGPAFVFLDLKMSNGSGHEVLAWVKDHLGEARPRIIVLTGSNEPRDRERVDASGVAAGYVVKPLTAVHLQAILGSAQAEARSAEPA